MATGGRAGYKRKTRNNVRLEKRGSDDSDEDYKVDEDEFDQSEDEYCSSLAEDESNESLGEFEEEEEEVWVEKKVKKVTRPRGRKNNGVVKRRKKKVSYKEEDEEEEEVEEEEDYDDDDDDVNHRKKNGIMEPRRKKVSRKEGEEEEEDYDDDDDFSDDNRRKNNEILKPRRKIVSYKEDEEEEDYDDDCADVSHRKNSGVMKQRRKISYKEEVDYDDDDDFDDVNHIKKIKVSHKEEEDDDVEILHRQKEDELVDEQARRTDIYADTYNDNPRKRNKPTSRKKKTTRGRRRKVVVNSDSEAIKEEEILAPERKQARKGKEKVVDTKIELVKQVCGICLSKEGKRTVKGVLNCCSHYFCFACIMEWSKVESRCPICKQRFTTINRTARVNGGNDLSDAVFPVPERDQVYDYQPSEEELRGFLDPYESFICTECQQDGDDAYMLLCDLCDSPAHTYCVGLGREVPDGNWYCDGCRTTLASSNGQTLTPTLDHRPSNNLSIGPSPVSNVRVTFDLNEVYVPDTPLAEHSQIQSPGNYRDFQAASPGGFGALTLYERRRIQRQIHQILNYRIRQPERNDDVGLLSGIHLFDSPIGGGGEIATQDDVRALTLYERRRIQRQIHQVLNNRIRQSGVGPLSGVHLFDSPIGGGGAIATQDDVRALTLYERRRIQRQIHQVLNNRIRQSGVGPLSGVHLFDSPTGGGGAIATQDDVRALTLYERRRIQRQIHQVLNNRIRQSGVGPLSGVHLFGSPIGGGGVIAPQPDDGVPARMAPQNIYQNGRLQQYNTQSVFSPMLSLREQALHNQASTSTNHSFGGLLNSEFGGGFSHQQLQLCSGRSNTGSDASTSPHQFSEATVPSRTLQGGSLHAPF